MLYTADSIEKKLEQYQVLQNRCRLLEYEFNHPESISSGELLKALSVDKANYETKSEKGIVYDKILMLVESYHTKAEHMNAEVVQQILLELHVARTELNRMESYVGLLPKHIGIVIRAFLMEGRSWHELEQITGYSRRTLMRRKRDGLIRLAGMYNYTGQFFDN